MKVSKKVINNILKYSEALEMTLHTKKIIEQGQNRALYYSSNFPNIILSLN